jgi:hypothetical protein
MGHDLPLCRIKHCAQFSRAAAAVVGKRFHRKYNKKSNG